MPQPVARKRRRILLPLVAVVAAGAYWWTSRTLQSASDDLDPAVLQNACGVERWAIKTLADDRGKFVLDGKWNNATLYELVTRPDPPWHSEATRSVEEEVQYIVDASIVAYKLEADRDVHIVLSDEHGLTMVAEFPDPNCVARFSAREPIARAREQLVRLLPADLHSSPRYLQPPIPVRIRGVLFFDRPHGQTGQAPNGAELYPVLEVSRRD